MRPSRLLLGALLLSVAAVPPAEAARHRRLRRALPVNYAPPPPGASSSPLGAVAGLLTVPLGASLGAPLGGLIGGGAAGTPIDPRAARFMGYPYNVPGYLYTGSDACLLRVGGPFGPGPSAGPCPFGLDRAF